MNRIIRTKILRNCNGSMLALTMIFIALLAFLIVIAYSFWGVTLVSTRLHTSANEIALVGAKKLNEKDRFGQLNNMIARCRQLVYATRQDYEKVKQGSKELETYAAQLLKETEDSALDLEKERKLVLDKAKNDASTVMKNRFDEIKSSYAMTLPWLDVGTPIFAIDDFGKLAGMESNVEELTKLPTLATKDRNNAYVVIHRAGLTLYHAETDGKLPDEQGNLVFKLSSLPAPVKQTVAPPRPISVQHFSKTKDDYFPSTVKISMVLDVSTKLGANARSTLKAYGTAITTGAMPQR